MFQRIMKIKIILSNLYNITAAALLAGYCLTFTSPEIQVMALDIVILTDLKGGASTSNNFCIQTLRFGYIHQMQAESMVLKWLQPF